MVLDDGRRSVRDASYGSDGYTQYWSIEMMNLGTNKQCGHNLYTERELNRQGARGSDDVVSLRSYKMVRVIAPHSIYQTKS